MTKSKEEYLQKKEVSLYVQLCIGLNFFYIKICVQKRYFLY